MVGTPDSPHHLTLGGETTTLRPLFLSALGDLCASREWRIDVSHVPIVTALVQGVVRPVPPLCGRRLGVLLAAVLSKGAAGIASAGSFSAGWLKGHRACGTPTQVHLEGCHHPKSKFAHLLLRDTLVLALRQVPTLATLQCRLAPLGPIPRDPQVAIPVAPLHLAPTRWDITPTGTPCQGSTPMDTPHQGITPMGTTHRAPLPAIRSTIRSIRRSTPSTMEASTPAAQAAQAAVLTLTEEDVSHLDGRELTKHKAERPTGTTCMLLRSFPLSLRAVFCLLSDFLVFSL
ncbi:uncharacterized protein LOC126045395 [Accipiter gentilis]|uniref:uncharacterized protein LOC126045395 n=1 Tax=Astur gentilis TaxID=8957 RepID=UPI00210F3CB0|nr:uncharacterized protein LOC126045395 [Accipiter gentilis]